MVWYTIILWCDGDFNISSFSIKTYYWQLFDRAVRGDYSQYMLRILIRQGT